MKNAVLKAIKQFSLCDKGDTVTVALSGGADSIALLFVLLSLKDELGITIKAAHLNHMIRGEEAERDQRFVEEICKQNGVELFCEKIDVPTVAKQERISLELAARKVRYEFFERIAIGKVATAHTASDNLETVLYNLARGTSIKGLCGIPAKRGIFIRPLLLCTREDVENYCKENNLSFVTDSTNLSNDYTRNKIRHNIIPKLKEINSAVENNVIKTAISLKEDNDFLENLAYEFIFKNLTENSLNIFTFSDISPALAKRVIKIFTQNYSKEIELDNNHINDIYSACITGKGKISLCLNYFAVIKNGFLFVEDGENTEKINFSVTFSKKTVDNLQFEENVNNLFLNNAIDCDKIKGQIVLRTKQIGDSIRLRNRGCTKTLKKLFTECKIPIEEREELPVLADDDGVVWVHKIGVAHRCAVGNTTKKVYLINTEENKGL